MRDLSPPGSTLHLTASAGEHRPPGERGNEPADSAGMVSFSRESDPLGRWNIRVRSSGRVVVEEGSGEERVEEQWYWCPERLLMGQHDAADDKGHVWAIACLLAEMVRGNPLFCSLDAANQLYITFRTLGFPSMEQVARLHPHPSLPFHLHPGWLAVRVRGSSA